MKKQTLKIIVLFIIIMVSTNNNYSQEIEIVPKNSTIPTMDKLFKLKWKFEDDDIRMGNLLVKNGIVFPSAIFDYCIDGITGDTILFLKKGNIDNRLDQLKDSFLLVSSIRKDEEKIINIKKGKKIISGSASQIESYLSDSKLLSDSIYYYPLLSRTLMAKDLNKPRRVLWKFETESDIIYDYIQVDSIGIIFTVNSLFLLKIKTGGKVWETEAKILISNPVLIGNNLFYIGTDSGRKTNTLYSIDLQNRKINWSLNFKNSCGYYGLAAEKNRVCYISDQGVHILDMETGNQLSLTKGNFQKTVVSIIDDYVIAYDLGKCSISLGTAINLNTGKVDYQTFTSPGFPAKGEEDMNDLAKEMKERGEADWWEGLGYNYLDGTDVYFIKDQTTGLIYGNCNGTIYCLEYVTK